MKSQESRDKIITRTSLLGIIVNFLIAVIKIVTGAITSSIAIVSEGANNATDALSSVMTLVGAKLAGKHPTEKFPFGFGRIEYLTSLIISSMILITGGEMLISGIERIFKPEDISVSYISLIIVFVAAVIKFFVGIHTTKMGKKTGSRSLIAVGEEGRNDSFSSIITIVSSLLFLIFGLNVDCYAGIIVSLIIIKTGISLLIETLRDIIGRPGDEELAKKLYNIIRSEEGVLACADMMLHNYGPDKWSGSVNIEIDHKKSIGEVYGFIHKLQLKIMHEYNVTMVFGIYAVDNDNPESTELRRYIKDFITMTDGAKSYHAVFIDSENSKIYCDIIVDYKLQNWEELSNKFTSYIGEKYPEYETELTVETEFV